MEIKLKKEIYSHLINLLNGNDSDLGGKIKTSKRGKYFCINLDEDDINVIRDLALSKIQLVGFDKNYKLTRGRGARGNCRFIL